MTHVLPSTRWSYGWRELGVDNPEHKQVMSTPAYIVGASNTTICVHGTVSGKVLVYSPERIVIEGSLVYAHDPRLNSGCRDYLGLLSSKDVEIARPDVTGPGDLEIHAAVFARRRFVVTDEDAREMARCLSMAVSPQARYRQPNPDMRPGTSLTGASSTSVHLGFPKPSATRSKLGSTVERGWR